jgi:hypothetical protein
MTPAPTFDQVAAAPPLYALSSNADAGSVPFWGGYFPSAGAGLGPTTTLEQAWADAGGTYVFLGAVPTSLPAFSQALADVLARLSPSGSVRLLWIENPDAHDSLWRVAPVQCAAAGSGPSIAWSVLRTAVLALGEYSVELPRGTAMAQAPETLGYGIAFAALNLTAPGGAYAADPSSAYLPFTGATSGCLRAGITLPGGGGDGLAALRVQLCYGAPHDDGADGDGVDVIGMAVVAQGSAAISLHLSYDPVHPLTAARSRLGFFDDGGGSSSSSPPALAATLRTSRGYPTTLTPSAAGAPLRPAALAFGRTPLTVSDPSAFSYHLSPDGAFTLTIVEPQDASDNRVMFGRSAQEYATLTPGTTGIAFFAAGQPALAPGAAPHAPPLGPDAPLLSAAATTSYLTILPPSSAAPGLRYWAQPAQAPLYGEQASVLPAGFLPYLELPAAALPSWTAGTGSAPATVPAAPLAGAAAADVELAIRVDSVLAPARRLAIGVTPTGARAPGSGTPAVTPQGLLVEVQDQQIDSVVIANMPATAQRHLELTSLGPQLRAALSAAELFAVVANPDAYLQDSSVAYELDEVGLQMAAAQDVPASVITALRPVVMPNGVPKRFDNEAAFTAAVQPAVPARYMPTILPIAGFMQAVMSGWALQLSPRAWRTQQDPPTAEDAPTIMLLKFAHRSLLQLVDDAAAWAWRAAAALPHTGELGTQNELRAIFAAARARVEDPTVPRDDPYVVFYANVVGNPDWNGVLFVNTPVDAARLPRSIQFVAAGVDQSRFYAHHVGFSATPVEVDGSAIAIRQTAAFGLIDYEDPYDLTLDPSDPHPVPFAFKTLQLTAQFANAALAGFHARVELMVNELLGARLSKLDPTHGNNLVLTGSLQTDGGGAPAYVFALEGVNRYATSATALDSLDVASVRVLTRDGIAGSGRCTERFVLGGQLRMIELPRFDAFGYGVTAGEPPVDGWLRFDAVAVDMSFSIAGNARPTFAADLTGVALDAAASQARTNSLVSRFPVTLAGFVAAGAGQRPEDLGWVSIAAPIDQQPLAGPWFGIAYSLDLGSLGALSGGESLTLGLLAAWGPASEPDQHPAYLGLKLPGYASGSFAWPLQGVMKLGFRSFQFETAEAAGVRSYALRLRRLGLSILGLSFPPGSADLVLFGDNGSDDRRLVGWYAAYEGPAQPGAGTRPGRVPRELVP